MPEINRELKAFIGFDSQDKEYAAKLKEILGEKDVMPFFGRADVRPHTAPIDIVRQISDGFIMDSDVSIILIGEITWRKRLIDCEIYASMLDSDKKTRSGIVGLILPTRSDYGHKGYYRYTIPPRIFDNTSNGYVKMFSWSEDRNVLLKYMKKAYESKDFLIPNLSRPLFKADYGSNIRKWNR